MSEDRFQYYAAGLTAPATQQHGIIPKDDNNDVAVIARGVLCNVGGTAYILLQDDPEGREPGKAVFVAGQLYSLRIRRLMQTDTDPAVELLAVD